MPARYAWVIDYDHLDNKNVKVLGPRNISAKLEDELEHGKGEQFRLYDDDGELYYSGRIVGFYDGFEPLYDYGQPNAGAVRIDYQNKEDNSWSTL